MLAYAGDVDYLTSLFCLRACLIFCDQPSSVSIPMYYTVLCSGQAKCTALCQYKGAGRIRIRTFLNWVILWSHKFAPSSVAQNVRVWTSTQKAEVRISLLPPSISSYMTIGVIYNRRPQESYVKQQSSTWTRPMHHWQHFKARTHGAVCPGGRI